MITESKQSLVVQDMRRKISRRDCLTGMAALGLYATSMSSLLTACDSGMRLGGPSSSSRSTTLLYGYFGSPTELAIHQQVAELYLKKNPNVTLNVTYADSAGFFQKLPLLFRSGAAPDVFNVAESWISGLSSLGGYEDLTSYLNASNISEDIWLPGALNPGKVKGQILSLPCWVYPKGIAYNKTLFEKYNVPLPQKEWTQSDFLAAAQALTRGQGNDKTWGMNNSFGTTSPYDVPTLYGGMIFDYNTGKMTATEIRRYSVGRYFELSTIFQPL